MFSDSLSDLSGCIAQWLERVTADHQVPGSTPGAPSSFANLKIGNCCFQVDVYVFGGLRFEKILSGLWCSGITSASHAEGPGFEPRRVHFVCSPGFLELERNEQTNVKQ